MERKYFDFSSPGALVSRQRFKKLHPELKAQSVDELFDRNYALSTHFPMKRENKNRIPSVTANYYGQHIQADLFFLDKAAFPAAVAAAQQDEQWQRRRQPPPPQRQPQPQRRVPPTVVDAAVVASSSRADVNALKVLRRELRTGILAAYQKIEPRIKDAIRDRADMGHVQVQVT
ncbi:MAG: hypothetical protein IH926_03420, partial [Proteobacteria bacterium]|nr:hypothetical protein [Pseudomonadota bacterium]